MEKKRRGRRKKEEEKKKKIQVWNFVMEFMYGTYMFGKTYLSWVRKTLTLQYMCILVG